MAEIYVEEFAAASDRSEKMMEKAGKVRESTEKYGLIYVTGNVRNQVMCTLPR